MKFTACRAPPLDLPTWLIIALCAWAENVTEAQRFGFFLLLFTKNQISLKAL